MTDIGEPATAGDVADLLGNLPELVARGDLTDGQARIIRYLADRPKAVRKANCPVCAPGAPSREFRAETDRELFALIADHTMKVHNGGSADAFNTAEDALPHVGAAYRKDAQERPWLYQ